MAERLLFSAEYAGGTGPYSIGSAIWPGLAKLTEECGETLQILGKIIAMGGKTEHYDGSDLRKRIIEEVADLCAAAKFFAQVNGLSGPELHASIDAKCAQFHVWQEEHKTPGKSFSELLEGAKQAYWHLDRWGFVEHPDEDLKKSQERVFELLRVWCPPIPGRLQWHAERRSLSRTKTDSRPA